MTRNNLHRPYLAKSPWDSLAFVVFSKGQNSVSIHDIVWHGTVRLNSRPWLENWRQHKPLSVLENPSIVQAPVIHHIGHTLSMAGFRAALCTITAYLLFFSMLADSVEREMFISDVVGSVDNFQDRQSSCFVGKMTP